MTLTFVQIHNDDLTDCFFPSVHQNHSKILSLEKEDTAPTPAPSSLFLSSSVCMCSR